MGYPQGSIVLATDPFKKGLRPFFIISNNSRPFSHEASTAAVMTTTQRDEAIEIVPGQDIEKGRLNKTSYINPWALMILRDEDVERRVAEVDSSLVQKVCSISREYLEFRD